MCSDGSVWDYGVVVDVKEPAPSDRCDFAEFFGRTMDTLGRASRRYRTVDRCSTTALANGQYAVAPMSLDYAADHLTSAVRSLATSERPMAERLQTAWDEHVQMVWMKPCLTRDLLREFRELWHRYTAPSDDRQSTTLRGLTREELVCAVDDLVSLATNVAVASAQASGNERLATLADLA
jgi:hypothetical protein